MPSCCVYEDTHAHSIQQTIQTFAENVASLLPVQAMLFVATKVTCMQNLKF